MPHSTNHHPMFNTQHTRKDPGITQPIPVMRPDGTLAPLRRPHALYPAYVSEDPPIQIGDDGWVGPDAQRLFTWADRNEAWKFYYAGFRMHPLPPMIEPFIGSCLIVARLRGEVHVRPVSRDFPHQQLWICKDMFGSTVMMTPQDALRCYLPQAREKRVRLRASR